MGNLLSRKPNQRGEPWPAHLLGLKRLYFPATIFVSAFFLLCADPASANFFDPHTLIADEEFTDLHALDREGIQQFLNSRNGILKSARFSDTDGYERGAAEIIYRASQKYQINPQILLVTLQKEQSLIENGTPSLYNLDWAMGYGICDSCSTDNFGVQQYRGFARQLELGTARLRAYLDQPELFGWIRTKREIVIDSTTIVPKNEATRALYLYTPHLSGNQKFWLLWNRYFAKHYPDGTVVQSLADGTLWKIDNGKRRKFESYNIFLSHNRPEQLLPIEPTELTRYSVGTPIHFSQYSLVRSPRGTVYLIVDGKKRGFKSKESFRRLGFQPFEVEDVGWDALDDYPESAPIDATSPNPIGQLKKNELTRELYYLQDGVKFPILFREIVAANFPAQPILPKADSALAKYPTGMPIGFNEGSLIKSTDSPPVYVISNRMRRPIASEGVFASLGFHWKNVITVEPKILQLHQLGSPLTLPESNEETATLLASS